MFRGFVFFFHIHVVGCSSQAAWFTHPPKERERDEEESNGQVEVVQFRSVVCCMTRCAF
jgi:hypothetical protein